MEAVHYEPAKAWRIALLLFIFMAINFIDKIVIGLLAVPMMENLHLKPEQFGLVASSFFWLYSISGVVGGFIANRLSASLMLLIMAFAWSLCQIPVALAPGLVVLMISRVVLGVVEGPAFPVAVHACYKWFPDKKRNLPVAFFAQGGMTGLLIAGVTIPLISSHWGWHANFYVLSFTGFLWVVLWRIFGSEGKIDAQQNPSSAMETKVAYRKLLREPTILGCFVLHFVAYWGLALTLTWLPAYLERGLGYSSIGAGRLYSAIVAVTVPIMMGISWISEYMMKRGISSRVARGLLSGITLIVSGAALLAIWIYDIPPLGRVMLLGVALGTSPVIYSLGPAMIAEVTPNSQRGGILAIDNSIASMAGIIAPLVSALFIHGLGNAAGYEIGFALCGGLMVIGGLVGGIMANPQRGMIHDFEVGVAEKS